MLEKLDGYKTVTVFTLTLLLGIAEALGWGGLELSPELKEWSVVILSVVGLFLRSITKSPMFKKK